MIPFNPAIIVLRWDIDKVIKDVWPVLEITRRTVTIYLNKYNSLPLNYGDKRLFILGDFDHYLVLIVLKLYLKLVIYNRSLITFSHN